NGAIDGADKAALAALLAAHGYSINADVNRDGLLEAADGLPLESSFSFIANRAPTVADVAATTISGVSIPIDLAALSHDLDGDALAYGVSQVAHGSVTLVDGGRTALFTPEQGYTGAAAFRVVADDGLAWSPLGTVAINVQAGSFTQLKLDQRDPVLGAGESLTLHVAGLLADGSARDLPSSQIQFVSSNPTVATIGSDGTIVALAAGVSIIEVHAYGRVAATPVTVGPRADRFLQFFPTSYVLEPNETRQFIVRERVDSGVLNLSSAADTAYYVADPSIGSITTTGLFTATDTGETIVTVIQGGYSFEAPLSVLVAQAGSATIGPDGGFVSDGH
ncbi:MAG TPA: Ig-like domain-containing protein, partial [Pirellulaceae bacterium]|nr:Ig-like domain-containing protein [Pirellulaceae bacterium]